MMRLIIKSQKSDKYSKYADGPAWWGGTGPRSELHCGLKGGWWGCWGSSGTILPAPHHPSKQGSVTEWGAWLGRTCPPLLVGCVDRSLSLELSPHVKSHQRTGPGVGMGQDGGAVDLLIHLDRAPLSGDQHINPAVMCPRG